MAQRGRSGLATGRVAGGDRRSGQRRGSPSPDGQLIGNHQGVVEQSTHGRACSRLRLLFSAAIRDQRRTRAGLSA